MNLVIVASHSLRGVDIYAHVIEEMGKLPEGSWVFLRKARNQPARPLEMHLAIAAGEMGLNVRWWMPEAGKGRAGVFERDIEMVGAADEVVAYFTENEEMSGGTGHVVEKALDQQVRCRAYSVIDGELHWVGGFDPEEEALGTDGGAAAEHGSGLPGARESRDPDDHEGTPLGDPEQAPHADP